MAPLIEEFSVSPSAERHMLEDHGVTVEEALEAAESTVVYRPTAPAAPGPMGGTSERRYMVPGKTAAGRRLWVFFADLGDGLAKIITAREARGKADRAWHRRMRGD